MLNILTKISPERKTNQDFGEKRIRNLLEN
jgi:hypothetical protein